MSSIQCVENKSPFHGMVIYTYSVLYMLVIMDVFLMYLRPWSLELINCCKVVTILHVVYVSRINMLLLRKIFCYLKSGSLLTSSSCQAKTSKRLLTAYDPYFFQRQT